jgi:preprotein translocase SecE subunit
MTASHDEPEDLPETATASGAAPRMARFGEGPEGRPARRERAEAEHDRDGFVERSGKFVRDVRAELGRTSWPSATQVRNTTIITIAAVAFFATYLYFVDYIFARGFELLARLVGAE